MSQPEPQTGTVQGQDQITIEASVDRVWELIADSKMLEQWGPVVDRVDVRLNAGETREDIGSHRHVYITVGKRSDRIIERRTEHNPNRRLAYRIEEDPFLGSYLKDSGFTMELDPVGHSQTLFTFTFYQRPRGIRGWLMNPLVRIMQSRGRRAGLASLKRLAEQADLSRRSTPPEPKISL